jgi:glutathione S-transferase
MKLYGSTTSPYVRRIRLYLASQTIEKQQYEFVNIDIFSATGREQLSKDNPTLKVPYLVDQQSKVLDSRIIHRYLAEKFHNEPLTWQQENILTLIDGANDSLVTLLLLQRSGFDTTKDTLFLNLQNERITTVLTALHHLVAQDNFDSWHYVSICLYCLLDWLEFRQLSSLDGYPLFAEFMANAKSQRMVAETDPRK